MNQDPTTTTPTTPDLNSIFNAVPGSSNPYSQLQMNLSAIFNKDNPLIPQTQQATSNFLDTTKNIANQFTPSASNPNNVNGVPLAMPGSAVESLISGQEGGKLAYLGSLDAILKGMYGSIPEQLQNYKDYQQLQLQQQAQELAREQFAFQRSQIPDAMLTSLQSNEQASRIAQNIQNLQDSGLDGNGFQSSSIPSYLKQQIAQSGASSPLWGLLTPDEQALAGQYSQLSGLGLHNLGARTSVSASNLLASGFASLGKGAKVNDSLINELVNNAQFESANIGAARLLSPSQLPGYNSTFGQQTQNTQGTNGTVPIQAPDGSIRAIPSDQVPAALVAGGKIAY